jgi:hypothetical protein
MLTFRAVFESKSYDFGIACFKNPLTMVRLRVGPGNKQSSMSFAAHISKF